MAVPREDACGAYASLALPAAKHRGRVWEPSQYRPRPKAGSFRRETWQPLTRLAALGDLSPLRSAPRGEVVSGQGSHYDDIPARTPFLVLSVRARLGFSLPATLPLRPAKYRVCLSDEPMRSVRLREAMNTRTWWFT